MSTRTSHRGGLSFAVMQAGVVAALRKAGWDDVAIGAVVLDRPARRQRSRDLKPYLVGAVHACRGSITIPWLGAVIGVGEETIRNWSKLPDPGPPAGPIDLPRPRPPRRKLPIRPSPTRLLELRDVEGLQIKQLAAHYGVSRDCIWRWTKEARRLLDVGGSG